MLTLRKGNLLNETGNIMHGVNCNPSDNDAGVAALIWEKHPHVLKQAQEFAKNHHLQGLGQYCAVRSKDVWVINAFTQYYGGPNFFAPAFTEVVKSLNVGFRGSTIKLPRIGAGIGGGDWSSIEDILLEHGTNINWEVICL